MPRKEKTEHCQIAGCSEHSTYYKRHCLRKHGFTEYIYAFFFTLCQRFPKTSFTYTFSEDSISFYRHPDKKILITVYLPNTESVVLPIPSNPSTEPNPTSIVSPQEIRTCPSTIPSSPIAPASPTTSDICRSPVPCSPGTSKLESLTPKKIKFPKNSVSAKLQDAGMYRLASETLPEIIGFRKLLHLAEGPTLTQKTKQMYINIRKLYQYMMELDPNNIFSEDNLIASFDVLISSGLKGDSLSIWIKGVLEFITYLVNRQYQSTETERIVIELCQKMKRREHITERLETIKRRRIYTNLPAQDTQFKWMEELIPSIQNIKEQAFRIFQNFKMEF